MYEDKEEKELFELLDNHKALTFQSQLDLRSEFAKRGMSGKALSLNETILKMNAEINDFIYLKDLGFVIEKGQNSIKVTRSKKAILADVFAVILGLLIPIAGFIGILNLVIAYQNDDEFGISSIVMVIIYGAMMFLGIKFLSGIKRLLDFIGFNLSKEGSKITMKKRFDLKLEEVIADASSLNLVKVKEIMILKLDGYNVLSCSAKSITQKMTIEALFSVLRNS